MIQIYVKTKICKTLLMTLWAVSCLNLLIFQFICLLCRSCDWKNVPPQGGKEGIFLHGRRGGRKKLEEGNKDSTEGHETGPVPLCGSSQGMQFLCACIKSAYFNHKNNHYKYIPILKSKVITTGFISMGCVFFFLMHLHETNLAV